MAKFSTGLRNEMLAGGSFKSIMDGGILAIFEGAPPASADEAVPGPPILVLTADGVGGALHFAAAAENGAIGKDSSELWKGTITTTGQASWFRYMAPSDTGGQSLTEPRIQGTIGVAGTDMLMANTTLTATEEFTLNYFTVVLPTV